MNTYQWLCLFGIPALIAGLFAYINTVAKKVKATEKGIQAMLRSQMVSEWNYWRKQEDGVPIWARDNFENLWIQYETLGANGVMTDIHNRFMALPIGGD